MAVMPSKITGENSRTFLIRIMIFAGLIGEF